MAIVVVLAHQLDDAAMPIARRHGRPIQQLDRDALLAALRSDKPRAWSIVEIAVVAGLDKTMILRELRRHNQFRAHRVPAGERVQYYVEHAEARRYVRTLGIRF